MHFHAFVKHIVVLRERKKRKKSWKGNEKRALEKNASLVDFFPKSQFSNCTMGRAVFNCFDDPILLSPSFRNSIASLKNRLKLSFVFQIVVILVIFSIFYLQFLLIDSYWGIWSLTINISFFISILNWFHSFVHQIEHPILNLFHEICRVFIFSKHILAWELNKDKKKQF